MNLYVSACADIIYCIIIVIIIIIIIVIITNPH